jgi:S1-C subfamily serine protease
MTRLRRFRSGVSRTLPLFAAAAFTGAALVAPKAALRAADLLQPSSDDTNSLFDKAKPAVVKVEAGDEALLSAGTGFLADAQGTVLTSSTIIGENTTARVTVNGLQMDAKVVGNDPRSGLAMLKVNYTDGPFLSLGHSSDLKTGYAVVAIGYPLNLPVSPAQGLISGFEVRAQNRFFCTTHIHAEVPVSPGQVGGPLLNMRGEVVGLIVPSTDDGQSLYALPVEAMEKIMSDFEQYGRAKHGWAGVSVIETPDTEHDGRTVRVLQAVPGTPASKSGILPGDTVLRIDAREIYRPADVLDASFFSHVGGTMNVVVRRGVADLFTYNFAVIERPPTPSATPIVSGSKADLPGRPVQVDRVTDR